MKLDLGCGSRKPEGYIGLDRAALPGVDHVIDLAHTPIPYPDSSVAVVRAYDFLEHLPNDFKIAIMNEVYRVLQPGGLFDILVPGVEGMAGAYRDPTHISYWHTETFDYFDPTGWLKDYGRSYGIRCAFEKCSLEYSGRPGHDQVCHIKLLLRAIKPLPDYLL